ncbi:NAD(P)H-binding protein [Mycolicibacterium komossense]|uniref:NAD(P)H-binding protein n=1 Tax=Mycolicibacterium komossense TaxID=1779 RepID=A0ABT3C4X9_9MYCO|nr:NAD(P)H-binding protein [Mycolicibacterium komossense]MCV7224490.1 NAD(P)H-binding protein [Mycolicibacterium komossense]
MRILVTGATGYVGSRLVGELLDAGHEVVVATRHPAKLAGFGWHDEVTGIALDTDDPAAVAAAFAPGAPAASVEVIYYLVHGIGEPGYRERDNAAAASVALAAKDAGVGRIVYLGGFVPADDTLSEHLAGRAEVAGALSIEAGAEVVWLGAAVIIGAGSTSFEMVRYIGDRLPLIPLPPFAEHAIDPISIRDVLYYLVAAADRELVPAGAYDIVGPDTTTYRGLIGSYVRAARTLRAGVPISSFHEALLTKTLMSRVAGVIVPVPTGLAVDLIESLDYPMTASGSLLSDVVPDPPGGLTSVDDAIDAAVASPPPQPVDRLADPHHLADSDATWAGGDVLRLRQLARPFVLPIARPALALLTSVPGPLAGAVRTGLDALVGLIPKADPA